MHRMLSQRLAAVADTHQRIDLAHEAVPGKCRGCETSAFCKKRAGLLAELDRVMDAVKPEHLTASEVADLLAVLAPAHARIRAGATPPRRPFLAVVPLRETAT